MTPLEAARKHPELLAGPFAIAGLAWWWTVNRMAGMDAGPGAALGTLGWFTSSWAVMMAAMMLPSFGPTLGAYATLTRGLQPGRWALAMGARSHELDVDGGDRGARRARKGQPWPSAARLATATVLALLAVISTAPDGLTQTAVCGSPRRPRAVDGWIRVAQPGSLSCLGSAGRPRAARAQPCRPHADQIPPQCRPPGRVDAPRRGQRRSGSALSRPTTTTGRRGGARHRRRPDRKHQRDRKPRQADAPRAGRRPHVATAVGEMNRQATYRPPRESGAISRVGRRRARRG